MTAVECWNLWTPSKNTHLFPFCGRDPAFEQFASSWISLVDQSRKCRFVAKQGLPLTGGVGEAITILRVAC
eukprot:38281-Eustigmatos_ZCMA.PRE.1